MRLLISTSGKPEREVSNPGRAFRRVTRYNKRRFGYRYAPELAPRLNLGADVRGGARMAVPVRKL